MFKISKYVFYDILQSRIALAYTIFLLAVSLSLFQMEANSSKATLGLLNIILIVVPLVSMVFSTIHWYNSYEFIQLMLTQPVSRKTVLLGEYLGISFSLLVAFFIGIGLPALLFHFDAIAFSLILTGFLLTLVFTSIGFLASVKSRDKARGIGAVLLLWFYFALIYDGLVLLLLFAFMDYPLEKLTLAASSLNPIDLARIYMMLQLDVSALMGYTGALFKDFFGSSFGTIYTICIMVLWIIIPLWLAQRSFEKKDL